MNKKTYILLNRSVVWEILLKFYFRPEYLATLHAYTKEALYSALKKTHGKHLKASRYTKYLFDKRFVKQKAKVFTTPFVRLVKKEFNLYHWVIEITDNNFVSNFKQQVMQFMLSCNCTCTYKMRNRKNCLYIVVQELEQSREIEVYDNTEAVLSFIVRFYAVKDKIFLVPSLVKLHQICY